METTDGKVPGQESSAAIFHKALSLPLHDTSAVDDDSDEWEYEYSATETETYYLTLDLTNPSIPYTRPKALTTGRGGHRSIWINPSLGRNKRQLGRAPTFSVRKDRSKAPLSASIPTPAPGPDRDSMDPDEHEDEDYMQDRGESIPVGVTEDMVDMEMGSLGTEDSVDEIQILDLHSENPLISWKGHTFSCSWAENIGTELLFAFRDPDNPIPILRALKDDVDLLAANSARLISTSVTLNPKKGLDNRLHGPLEGKFDSELKRKRDKLTIPIGKEAKEPRREQANFLERLTEVKKMKGEEDEVTINAQRRLYQSGWKILMSEKREEKRRELRSVFIRGGEEGRIAFSKLEEMDREDEAMVAQEKKKKESQAGNKRSGRKSKDDGENTSQRRPVVVRRPRGARMRSRESADLTLLSMPSGGIRNGPERVLSQSMLSTPTPRKWAEIGGVSPLEQLDDDYAPEV